MIKLTVWLLLILNSFFSFGQFSDSTKHFIRLAASGNVNRTNTSRAYFLKHDLRYRVRTERNSFNASADWVYGNQKGTLTNNDFNSAVDFNLFSKPSHFYYWGLGTYTSSYSLKIRSQIQSGIGLGYNFVNTDTSWINVSDGILFEASHLRTTESNTDDNYQTFRNSLRLSYRRVIKGVLTISGINFIQNSLKDGSDYSIRSTNSLSFKLNKWISIGTSVIYNQFRRTRTENLLFTYEITAERYF
jgi:hypothetical protein